MPKGINFKPTKENRKFLESIQNDYGKKGVFRGFSQILNKLITDVRLKGTRNPFR